MFKLMGSAMVIMAAGLIGAGKYSSMCERLRMLAIICDGAERIRNNLKCMCMPLYESFLHGGEFFSKVSEYMAKGESPPDSVKMATDTVNCLEREDRELLFRFSEGLSRENCDGQIRNLDFLIEEIKKSMENAKQQLDGKGRLFLKGSLLVAAAVVLVLI